ncbi:MAG: hypothetical protein C4297_02010 [Gemmataceae bacterium]
MLMRLGAEPERVAKTSTRKPSYLLVGGQSMNRAIVCSVLAVTILAAGCVVGPDVGNPARVQPPGAMLDNPAFVPQSGDGYGLVFDRTYDVLQEFFDIAYSNRFDGRIETHPRILTGYADPWSAGLLGHEQNMEATLQTIRRRAVVTIRPAEAGGYYIDVQVLKELEDLPQPARSSTGSAVFRVEQPLERIEPLVEGVPEQSRWIPLGRDPELEQVILRRLQKAL